MIRNWLPRSIVALIAMLAIAGTATTANAQDKLDRALREGKNSGKAQRVILKAKPGYEAWARELLARRARTIDAELPSIGAFAVELSAAELDAICQSTVFDGCSEDTLVTPTRGGQRGRNGGAERGVQQATLHDARQVNTVLGTLGLNAESAGRARRDGRGDRLRHPSVVRVRHAHQGVLRLHRGGTVKARPSTTTATARTSPA